MQQYFVMASWLSCLLGLRRPPVRRVPFRSLAFFSGSFTLKLGIATASVEARLQRKCGKCRCCRCFGVSSTPQRVWQQTASHAAFELRLDAYGIDTVPQVLVQYGPDMSTKQIYATW